MENGTRLQEIAFSLGINKHTLFYTILGWGGRLDGMRLYVCMYVCMCQHRNRQDKFHVMMEVSRRNQVLVWQAVNESWRNVRLISSQKKKKLNQEKVLISGTKPLAFIVCIIIIIIFLEKKKLLNLSFSSLPFLVYKSGHKILQLWNQPISSTRVVFMPFSKYAQVGTFA